MVSYLKLIHNGDLKTVALDDGMDPNELSDLLSTAFGVEGKIVGIIGENELAVPLSLLCKSSKVAPQSVCKILTVSSSKSPGHYEESGTNDNSSQYCPAPAVVHCLNVPMEFPSALLEKDGSIHASSIISNNNQLVREHLRNWFQVSLATVTHFELEKPEEDERGAKASRLFRDYKNDIQKLGYTVWNTQKSVDENVSIMLQDPKKRQKRLSGRADYIIASAQATCREAASIYALCIVEIQSKENTEDCELQLITYLVLMMNVFGLPMLTGILIYNNGTCRAYRASRNGGATLYEGNDTFPLQKTTTETTSDESREK
eukprot:gene13547-14906_t